MKTIKSKLFENFKAEEISNISKVIGGLDTATQNWITTTTECEGLGYIPDASMETDIQSTNINEETGAVTIIR